MALSDDYKNFIKELAPDKLDAMSTSTGEIAKKMNKKYYDLLLIIQTFVWKGQGDAYASIA